MSIKSKAFLKAFFHPNDRVCLGLLYPEDGSRAKQFFGTLDESAKQIQDWDDKGVLCFCINPIPPKVSKRSKESIDVLNTLVVDIDGHALPDLKGLPQPHFIFQRGNKNFHLYWLLDRQPNTDENREKHTVITKKFLSLLNGDDSVIDACRFMRIPGTQYIKDGKRGAGYKLKERNDVERYSLEALHKQFGEQHRKQSRTEANEKKERTTKPADDKEIETYLLQSRPAKVRRNEGRSRILFYFALDCFGWGVDKERAYELAETFNASHCVPPEPPRILKHQVDSAYRYSRGNFGEFRDKVAASETKKKQQEVFEKFRLDQDLRRRFASWVFVVNADRMVNLDTNLELTTSGQIENFLAHLSGQVVNFKYVLRRGLVRVCDSMDFRPDRARRFYREKGLVCLNLFGGLRTFKVTKNETSVKVFLKHLDLLTTTKDEAAHLLKFLAYNVQNPGRKINHAVLLISKYEGLGKSLLEILMRNLLRSRKGESYVNHVTHSQIVSDYTDYLSKKLLCFVHELGEGDRWSTMDRLKSLVTEDRVTINAKYARQYAIRNTVNFVFFSNYSDAIRVGRFDRRLFVVYNDKAPESTGYYERVASVFENDFSAIHGYLDKLDLSTFNPYARPPGTLGKDQLIEQSQNELSIFLNTSAQQKEGPFAKNVLTLADIREFAEISGPVSIRNKVSQKAIRTWFLDSGFDTKDVDRNKGGVRFKQKIFFRAGYTVTKKDVDELLEQYANGG